MKHEPPLILVADDEVTAATMLRHVFEREGYQVDIAEDGLAALSIAKQKVPDLILLDIQMPQMNGFEVLRQLRESPTTSAIPTIIVSARARTPSDVALGLDIGADDYISKPFAPQELLARARSKMRARQLEESLQQRTQELEILLRTSEELNHHLEIDELLSLVLFLTLDLLPADFAFIARYDANLNVTNYRTEKPLHEDIPANLETKILAYLDKTRGEHTWNNNQRLGHEHGIQLPLTHGNNALGILLVATNKEPFTVDHQMLFRGIARQSSLALHNAQLYEMQANYALHLEDMVAQRTKELQQAQQLLFRSEKLASIGNLAASIAHEINNPLQPIQLNLEYLLEDTRANMPIDVELIEMTQQSVQRISRIVRQLLEFTKSNDSNAMALVQVTDILESIIKLNQRTLERNHVFIEKQFDDVPEIQANRDQLEQVFMNIILNANAAMPNGGTLQIQVEPLAEHVSITFQDTGTGIPEDMINNIFDPFVSTKDDGTGLGLFVSYGIIEKHQGNIEVKSKVNEGTTMTITLPHAQASKSTNDRPASLES